MKESTRAGEEQIVERETVPRMFDRIAFRYDQLNRLLSLGLDMRWRKLVARHLATPSGQRIVDLATGTGDQILAILEASDRVDQAVGFDLAEEMLALGRAKIDRLGLTDRVTLDTGDACAIPSPDDTFDAATMAFGIRNVPDVSLCLREMRRVLRSGGRALILEFSLPRNRFLRLCHRGYLRHVLPRVGGCLSGDFKAYRYLNRTIESFPYGEAFCDLMREAGFGDVTAHPLNGGIVTLYVGSIPAGDATP